MKNKTHRISIRCTEKEKNLIKRLADDYAMGDMTAWIIYQSINGARRFLKGYDKRKKY